MTILIPLLILLALAVLLTCPSLRYAKMRRWKGERFAHRGLHGPTTGLVENTLPAFESARDHGFGMELDIQFSLDRQVVVFHDDDLRRLCGDPRMVREVPLAELKALPLNGRDDAHIPTLKEVLDAVGGKVPLLIELKNGKDNARLCQALLDMLADYRGEVLIESFNPLIVFWFRRHAPQLLRGQLVNVYGEYLETVPAVGAFALSNLLMNVLARPDFVAYNVDPQRFPAPRFQRAVFRTPLAAWTVRDKALAARLEQRGEICIFEDIWR